jgi:putative YhbY family RNA-binding protein
MLDITPAERRALRAKAHHLDPVVSIGQHGLTPPVMQEIDRALAAHALVKVRVHSDARAEREAMLARIADELAAAPVQHLGKLLIVWRPLPVDQAPAVAMHAAGRRKPAKARSPATRPARDDDDRSSMTLAGRRRSRRVDQRPSETRDEVGLGRSRKSASASGATARRRPGPKKPQDDVASRRGSTVGNAPGQRKRGASSAAATSTQDDRRRRRGATLDDSARPRAPGKPARHRSTTSGSGSPAGSGSSSRRRDDASGASTPDGSRASRGTTRAFKTVTGSSASTPRRRGGASGAKASPASFNPRRRRRG